MSRAYDLSGLYHGEDFRFPRAEPRYERDDEAPTQPSMTPITEPGIYPEVTSKEYHADPVVRPSLNSSIAKILVTRSPKHAWLAHPRLGGAKAAPNAEGETEEKEEKVSKQKLLGSLIHRLVLGKGGDIVVCEFDSWRKDAAKAMRAEALAQGNIPTLPKLYEEAQKTSAEARRQLDEMGLGYVFRDGLKEVTLVWKEGEDFFRAMLDHLIIDEHAKTAEIWDLKTVSRSSHPKACAAQIVGMGYDLSATFYKQGLQSLRPDLRKISFRWAFVEVAPPCAVTPCEIDGEWQTCALQHYCNALDAWKKCVAANRWPTYVDKLTRLEAEPWMLAAAIGAEVAGNLS